MWMWEGKRKNGMAVPRQLAVILLTFFSACMAGCASTTQYAQFAQAGSLYATAVDQLLITAGNTKIDATSESLLQDDALSNQTVDSYEKLSSVDRERLAIIRRLRTHAQLLARYFGLFNELATSDAPQRAQQEVGAVVTSLNTIGQKLRGSDLVANPDVFKAVTQVAVGLKIRGIARKELTERKETIQVELTTQEVLLKALSGSIEKDLKIATQSMEQRLVIQPLIAVAPIAKPDQWVADRRKVLTAQETVAELDTASDAAQRLREAFEDLVQDKLNLQQLNTILADLESLLTIAEAINRRPGG